MDSRNRNHLFTTSSAVIGIAAVLLGCRDESSSKSQEDAPMAKNSIVVTSSSFQPNAAIPRKHAYPDEGQNVSPAIAWSGIPPAARELALICDDPDAPQPKPWVHWVVIKIPPTARGLAEGVATNAQQLTNPAGALQGSNSFRQIGWGGPYPPEGHGTHHYHFKVYALDTPLSVAAGGTKDDVVKAMAGHVLAEGELIGTYER